MPDLNDLRQKAEAALAVKDDMRSLGMRPDRVQAFQDFADAWHPGVALAALRVVDAAEAWRNRIESWNTTEGESFAAYQRGHELALDAALRDFREAK